MVTDDVMSAWTSRPKPTVTLASMISVAALLAIWLDAVPRDAACPAIYPAPEGCTPEHRRNAGVAWTAAVATTYVLVVAGALTKGRRARWVLRVGLVILALVGLVGYGAVMGSTGYVIY